MSGEGTLVLTVKWRYLVDQSKLINSSGPYMSLLHPSRKSRPVAGCGWLSLPRSVEYKRGHRPFPVDFAPALNPLQALPEKLSFKTHLWSHPNTSCGCPPNASRLPSKYAASTLQKRCGYLQSHLGYHPDTPRRIPKSFLDAKIRGKTAKMHLRERKKSKFSDLPIRVYSPGLEEEGRDKLIFALHPHCFVEPKFFRNWT